MMKMFSLCSSGGVNLPLLLLLFILLSACCCDGHRHVNETSRSKGVFICITGQLARLELKNKIERLLLPLHSLGFDLYIALALHNSTHYFSNNNIGDNMRLVPSLDHAMSVLRGVDGVKEVMHYLPQHPENMFVNEKYLKLLDKRKKVSRVQNHARQYQSLQFCNQWPLIKKMTQVTVRVREDILFEMSNMSEILSNVKKGKIVTPACESWRGINDKVAFLPSSLAHPFFHYPYERYLTFNTHIRDLNSEQFYYFVYKKKGLRMKRLPFNDSTSTELMPHTLSGMRLSKQFTDNMNDFRPVSFPSSEGTAPVRRLSPTSNTSSAANSLRELGIVPVKRFPNSDSLSRVCSKRSSRGNDPDKTFLLKSKE